MPIVACFLTPEGVVIGADSAAPMGVVATISPGTGPPVVQRVFQVADTLGMAFWGDALHTHLSPRSIAATLADEFARHSPPTVHAAAARVAATLESAVARPGSASRKGRAPSLGCCIAGHLDGEAHAARAYEIALVTAGAPVVRPLPFGGSYWGSPGFVSRFLWGIDAAAFDRILASRRWKGTRKELLALLDPSRLDMVRDLPLSQALEWVYTLLFSSVHAAESIGRLSDARGPLHLAVIACDAGFRWVCHTEPWESLSDPLRREHGQPLNTDSSVHTLATFQAQEEPLQRPHDAPSEPSLAQAGPDRETSLGENIRARGSALHLMRNGAIVIALTLLVGGILAGLAAKSAADAAPAWWRSVDPESPQTLRSARDLQNEVITQLHWTERGADPGFQPASARQMRSGEWTMRLGEEEVNAWLNVEFPKWVVNQMAGAKWPGSLRDLQVNFREGQAQVGVRIVGDGRDRYLSATLHPRIEADGSLWVTAAWVRVGRLPLPADWAIAGAVQWQAELAELMADSPEARQVVEALQGAGPLFDAAVIRLEDGRQVHVLELEITEGVLAVTCRTTRD